MTLPSARTFAIGAALATIYIVWGSTYLAIHVAVQDIPPLLLAGTRFLTAGVLLYAATRWRGEAAPSRRAWTAASVVGLLMFVVSHGLLSWASQFVTSGTAALISSASPAWIALGASVGLVSGHKPNALGVAGIILGLAGVALALDPRALVAGDAQAPAIAGLLAGSLAWAIAGLLTRWSALPSSALLTAAMTMTSGGAMLIGLSAATGEPARLHLPSVAPTAWAALAYLTFVGSLLAYACYVWILREDGPARASAHAFVNPIVAILLGALVANEPFTRATALSASLVVAGVALVSLAPRLESWRARRSMPTPHPSAPCISC